MRLAIAATALLVAAPTVASARPITAGISFGKLKSKVDAASGADANGTIGLYGRISLSPRVGAQLELQRIETDGSNNDLRSGTGLVVFELGAKGRLVPLVVAGYGIDKASSQYGFEQNAHHVEGGLALEYRADGGFVIGADLRIGDRTLEDIPAVATPAGVSSVKPYVPSMLTAGEYRAARISIGIQF